MSAIPKMIVAEISKNWVPPNHPPDERATIGEQFERCIEHNAARGYTLHSWKLSQTSPMSDTMVETIIAVFERYSAH